MRAHPGSVRRIATAILALVSISAAGAASAQDGLTARIAESAVELSLGADADLPELDRAIEGARIILLGEPWHGDGGAIQARAQLVRYLHERHDFDVLVFEGDFYALNQGWAGLPPHGRPSEMASANLYPFWSQTLAAEELWSYVDSEFLGDDPLIVAGIDTKVVGEITRRELPDDLARRLVGVGDLTPEAAGQLASTLRRLLDPQPTDPQVTAPEFEALVAAVEQLAEILAETPGSDPFWSQYASSLRRMLSGESRDLGMAENLIWTATQLYPGRRIIVWTHNNHALVDKWALYDSPAPEARRVFGNESADSVGRRTYLGEATRHYFGDRAVYAIATLSHVGTYSSDIEPALIGAPADFDRLAVLEATAPGTLEALMADAGHNRAFVDLRPFRGDPGLVATRALDYSQLGALPLLIQQGFDGVLFLRRTHGLNEAATVAP